MKAWIIAEQLPNAEFRIVRILDSKTEPLDEFRREIVGIFRSYDGQKIALTIACLFGIFDELNSRLLLSTVPQMQSLLFTLLKDAGKTYCGDVVSIQRAAWCHSQQADVLKYSFQNGGGGRSTVAKLNRNPDFR